MAEREEGNEDANAAREGNGDSGMGPGAGYYRIGALARLTGLTPHTIRVWERRYGALTPQRTPGGDRRYSEADYRRLRQLVGLKNQGFSIGSVAGLSDAELETLALEHRPAPEPAPAVMPGVDMRHVEMREGFLDALTHARVDHAERLLSRAVGVLEPRELIEGLLVPLLEEIGERWAGGELSVAQEHLASALFRNHLAHVMRVYGRSGNAHTAVATTLPGEAHEFGALMASILAATLGWKILYLGPNLPLEDITTFARENAVRAVLLSVVVSPPEEAREALATIRAGLPAPVAVIVGGMGAARLGELPEGITRVADLNDFEDRLRSLQ